MQAQSGDKLSARDHAVRANDALKAGHPEKAIPEFQALVVLEPSNVDAQANLGVLLYFQKDYVHAISSLRTALQLGIGLSAVEAGKLRALLGQAEAAVGQVDDARNDLGGALKGLAGDAKNAKLRKDVGLKLVELDTAHDDFAGAATAMQTLLADSPNDPEILYASYRVYSDLAGQSLLNLSLAAPQSGRMQQAIANELERVRDYHGAEAALRKALAAEPNLPGVHYELAELLRASDSNAERAQAEAEYELALKQDPSQVQAAARLGDIHFERGDLDGAAKFYQAALDKQPQNEDAALGMSRVYSERGENDRALALLQGAVRTDPGNMLAHFRLSALYRKMHRQEDAKRELADYQRIKDLKEKLHEVYSSMKIAAPHNADADTTGKEAKRGDKP